MAPPKKKKFSELSDSAKFYRRNKKSRDKKKKTDKKVNSRPEQKRKRAQLVKERRKRKIYGKFDGRDLAHKKDGTVRLQSAKKNRGDCKTSKGDIKSRSKKK